MLKKEEIENISAQINWIVKDSVEFFREFDERLTLLEIRYGIKAGFNPNQPRVPAGNPDGGQWTADPGYGGRGSSRDYPNDAIEEVPIEYFFGIVGITRGLLTRNASRFILNNVTKHGSERFITRGISAKHIEKALRTAKKTGNISTKIGKYGSEQVHYKGSNGITVVIETSGRNAGKIITVWRH